MTWCQWADTLQNQLNIVKTLPWNYLKLEKSTDCGKIIFQKDAESSVSNGATEFRAHKVYGGGWENIMCVCVCVCVCVFETNNLVIPYNPTFETALQIIFLLIFRYSTLSVLWRSWLHILTNSLWPLSLRKLSGVEIFAICLVFQTANIMAVLNASLLSVQQACICQVPALCCTLRSHHSFLKTVRLAKKIIWVFP